MTTRYVKPAMPWNSPTEQIRTIVLYRNEPAYWRVCCPDQIVEFDSKEETELYLAVIGLKLGNVVSSGDRCSSTGRRAWVRYETERT